jgi:hypothetical protein
MAIITIESEDSGAFLSPFSDAGYPQARYYENNDQRVTIYTEEDLEDAPETAEYHSEPEPELE